MVRDVYVVDHLYLCVESLIQIEMCNESGEKIFFFLKAEKRVTLHLIIPKKKYLFNIIICYMI